MLISSVFHVPLIESVYCPFAELRDIKMKPSIDSTVRVTRYLDTAKPTTSVFVKTYNSITFGTKDKLKYLFTSQKYGGRKVVKVEQLNTKDDDCYELFFLNWGLYMVHAF